MKQRQQAEYIHITNGCQQLKLRICCKEEIQVEKNEFFRQVSAQLERLDYRELYGAYSGMIRKSQVEPRILFEILVCAYARNVYSSRKIRQLCEENIQFILLLDGHAAPDYSTITRFRSGKKTAKAIENMFYQYAALLETDEETNHEAVFIDGTKLESKANRYTFVWRKTVERELKKIKEKLKTLLPREDGYLTVQKIRACLRELNKEIEESGLTVQKGRGHQKPKIIRLRDELQMLLERWEGYEAKKKLLGEGRNSYAKTDPDATFMHMKEDHMRNGQLKPGYNVQFAVNSEYITGIGVFSCRTDYATLAPLLDTLAKEHGRSYRKVVADAGYESLSNYRYLSLHGQEAYIKPNNYQSRKTKKYKAQIGRAENMAYYAQGDYFVCKGERILARVSTQEEIGKDGIKRETARYRCEDCCECPHRSACCKAKDEHKQKEVVVCWEMADFRLASLERITTGEGVLLRVNRSIQSEGSFAQLKHNRSFKRFLTSGTVKVLSELYLLALSQNIVKRIAKRNAGKQKTHLLQPKVLLKF